MWTMEGSARSVISLGTHWLHPPAKSGTPVGRVFGVAEREGFEPPVPFREHTLSRRAP
jgi:hypothetical protein